MPVTTRSQTKSKAIYLSQATCVSDMTTGVSSKTTSVPPRNPYSWYVKELTYKWTEIIESILQGYARTNETAILTKNGVQYNVCFEFTFKYDRSNGMQTEQPRIVSVLKSNHNDTTPAEIDYIRFLIKQQYNKILREFYLTQF